MKKLVYIFLFLLGLNCQVKAQNNLSIVDSTAISFLDTVYGGSTVPIVIKIANLGNTPITNFIELNILVDNLQGGISQYTDTLITAGILPGDSATFVYNHEINMTRYSPDNNITVIWPATPFEESRDSLFIPTYVIEVLSVKDPFNNAEEISLFPNPTRDFVSINSMNSVEQVRVFNSNGKLVATEFYSQELDLSFLNSGLYFIEVKTSAGLIPKKLKIIKR